MPLTRRHLAAFGFELRDTVDACLYQLDVLTQQAAEWVASGEIWTEGGDELAKMARNQQRIFDAVESFLAAYARTSLILFPISDRGFTGERGRAIRERIGIDESSPLADRDFRDSWMHHDERLDTALESGTGASGQRFALSAEITAEMTSTFLRVFAVDTLEVHYRKRDGSKGVAKLSELRAALEDLDARRRALF